MAEREPSKNRLKLHLSLTHWVDDETGALIMTEGLVTDAQGNLISALPLFNEDGDVVFGVRLSNEGQK